MTKKLRMAFKLLKKESAKKRLRELNLENLKLVEQMSLSEAKAVEFKKELASIKKELATHKAFYES